MSVVFKNKDGVLHIKGNINSSSFVQFQTTLQNFFMTERSLLLNVDKVNNIDANGILVLYKLYKKAKVYNREFKILGNKGANIYSQICI